MLFVILVAHECSLGTRERTLAVFTIWYLTSFLKPILELDVGKPRGKKLLYIFFAGFFSAFLLCFSTLSLLSLSDSELVLVFIAASAAHFMIYDYPFQSKNFCQTQKSLSVFLKNYSQRLAHFGA